MFYTFLMNIALIILVVVCVMYASKHKTLEDMLTTMQTDLQNISRDVKTYACSAGESPPLEQYKSKPAKSAKSSRSNKKNK